MIPKEVLSTAATKRRFELYCLVHPETPSAERRPQLFIRSGAWVALLGQSIRDGIAGFGGSVESALSAFDVEYLNKLPRPGAQRVERVSRAEAQTEPREQRRRQVAGLTNTD